MMKWARVIIPAILLLLVWGCSRNDTFHNNNNKGKAHPEIEKRSQSQPVLRFDNKPDDNSQQIKIVDTFEYYRPEEKIIRTYLIALKKNIEIQRNSIETGAFFQHPTLKITDATMFRGTSSEVFFTAVFDNDIFDYTDYYYTNGVSLELYHPAIGSSPICRILPGLKHSLNYYGLILVQNMYTPLKLEETDIRVGDRPFAAYLTISHRRISLSADRRRRLQTELALGTIGPAALGGVAQDMIHTNTPVGWVNQVKNDVVANYSICYDQGLCSGKSIEVAVVAGAQAGTLYDNLTGGFYVQAGKFNDRYGSLFQTTSHQKTFKERIRYYFSFEAKNKLVMYDATLQGGMFNRENVYSLNGGQVKHYVFTGTASFGLGLGRYSLEAEQVFLTPEFEGGRHHLWFRIKNIIYLN